MKLTVIILFKLSKKIQGKLDFYEVSVIKPSFISDYIDKDFIQIKIDYLKKAVGNQAILFYNISPQNLKLKNKSVIGKTIHKIDVLKYQIDINKFNLFFFNLFFIFSTLSN